MADADSERRERQTKAIRELYGELGKASYENAKVLLDEAHFLLEQKRSPRAYVLAVFCLEELTKSVISRNVWAGAIGSDDFAEIERALRSHKLKQLFFGVPLLLIAATKDNPSELLRMIRLGRTELHSDSLNSVEASEVLTSFAKMERDRQSSIYVGVDRLKVVTPTDAVDLEKCGKLLRTVEALLPFYDGYLKMSVEEYQTAPFKLNIGHVPRRES